MQPIQAGTMKEAVQREKGQEAFSLLGTDAAIDLGTSRTRIYLPQQGVVIDEPSVVAVDNMTEEIIAIGQEAYEMVDVRLRG